MSNPNSFYPPLSDDYYDDESDDDLMWRCSNPEPHGEHMVMNAVQSFCAGRVVSSSSPPKGDTT